MFLMRFVVIVRPLLGTAHGSCCLLLALLPLLLRPLGKDLVNGVGQRSILLGRRTAQLRLQLRLNKRANKFSSRFHTAKPSMAGYGGQRTPGIYLGCGESSNDIDTHNNTAHRAATAHACRAADLGEASQSRAKITRRACPTHAGEEPPPACRD